MKGILAGVGLAVMIAAPVAAQTFEETAAFIMGGLEDNVKVMGGRTPVWKKLSASPAVFEFVDPREAIKEQDKAFATVKKVGDCIARLEAPKLGFLLELDFNRLVKAEGVKLPKLAPEDPADTLLLKFSGQTGFCRQATPDLCSRGAYPLLGQIDLNRIAGAATHMKEKFCKGAAF